jgi:hypothetical protein
LRLAAGDKGIFAGQALAWSRDGERLVTCNSPPSSEVRVWSEKGELQHEFQLKDFQAAYKRANSNFYHASAFFRPGNDDEVVLVGAVDLLMRTAMLLDLSKKTVRRAFLDAAELGRVSFELPGALSPDGNRIALPAMRNGNGIFLVDLTGKEEKHQIGGRFHSRQVGWSTKGPTLGWAMTDPKKKLDRALDLNRGLDLEKLLLQLAIDPAQFVKDVRERDGWSIKRPPTKSGRGGIEIFHNGELKSDGGRFTQNPGSQWTFPAKGDVSWLAWTGKEELFLADPQGGPKKQKTIVCVPTPTSYYALASSADGQYLLTSSTREMFHVYRPASKQRAALLMAFVNGADWIVWTHEGYYAATPGGEKMMGWTVNIRF